MKARPILFSSEMVRALLDGRKTQTRRMVKPQPEHTDTWTTLRYFGSGEAIECGPDYPDDESDVRKCPHGQPGDLLYVRETWAIKDAGSRVSLNREAWPKGFPIDRLQYIADRADGVYWWNKRVSIHMPRWASRLTLEIKSVRVERVQSISQDDALAEGVTLRDEVSGSVLFSELWDSINGERVGCSWQDNPWVWVIEFEVHRCNVDEYPS